MAPSSSRPPSPSSVRGSARAARWVLLLGLGACAADRDGKPGGTASGTVDVDDGEGSDDTTDGEDGDGGSGDGVGDGGAGDDGDDGVGDGDDGGSEGGDEGPGLEALSLTVDAPAFYDASGLVTVRGSAALAGGTLAEVEVGGIAVVVEDDRYEATLDLGGKPWDVVSVVARVGAETATLHTQLAHAAAPAVPVPAALASHVDRDVLDQLGAHLGTHLSAADLAPAAGIELGRATCPGSPIPAIESSEYTEVLETDGGARFALAVAVDPSTGALVLDLAGSELVWTLDHELILDSGSITATLEATATLAAPVAPAGACTGVGLAVQSDASDASWALDTSALHCISAVDTAPLAAAYAAGVVPAVEAAVCDWGGWLDGALAPGLGPLALAGTVGADAAGVDRLWSAEGAAPWLAGGSAAADVAADGLAGGVDLAVLGMALDAAWRAGAALGPRVVAELDGQELALDVVGVAEGAGALAADDSGAAFLAAPLAVTVSVEDRPCATLHLVPGPAALVASGASVSVAAPSLVGVDALHGCPVGPDSLAPLADEALAAVGAGLVEEWTVAQGLVDDGAAVTATVALPVVVQQVDVPRP